ncbi:TPA: 50S ribosomal protein L18a, partial [Candidatus Bathyarchaeota archaeon]|nr:50S ribosomal protein L18a [Candidatus Bathyarchaeota archaeon]
DAIEELYKIFGSKHRVKRFQIKIEKVEEISAEELNEQT